MALKTKVFLRLKNMFTVRIGKLRKMKKVFSSFHQRYSQQSAVKKNLIFAQVFLGSCT